METRRHFSTFHIAGFTYWDGCIVFKELEIGTELALRREADNRFDPYAVAIYFGEHKLGFVPRTTNKEINKFLEQGYDSIFEVRINRICPEEHPENQVHVVVFLKGNEAAKNSN